MKLRRALATAVAAAAIAPATLLAAPAAFAADASAPLPASTTASVTVAKPAPAVSAPEMTGKPIAGTAPSASTTTSPWDKDCVAGDQLDANSLLKLQITGLPSTIAAGSGWHEFQLTANNTSASQALGETQWFTAVGNFASDDMSKDLLLAHAHLQFFNGTSWVNLEGQVGTGITFGKTSLDVSASVSIKLRVSIDLKAPVGVGLAVGLGGYADNVANCTHNSFAQVDLNIAAPGSTQGTTTPAKPVAKPKPPVKVTVQNAAAVLPATSTGKSLAHTGASSATPVIAGIGAAAVVLGAGAMFVVRRRKGGSAA